MRLRLLVSFGGVAKTRKKELVEKLEKKKLNFLLEQGGLRIRESRGNQCGNDCTCTIELVDDAFAWRVFMAKDGNEIGVKSVCSKNIDLLKCLDEFDIAVNAYPIT